MCIGRIPTRIFNSLRIPVQVQLLSGIWTKATRPMGSSSRDWDCGHASWPKIVNSYCLSNYGTFFMIFDRYRDHTVFGAGKILRHSEYASRSELAKENH